MILSAFKSSDSLNAKNLLCLFFGKPSALCGHQDLPPEEATGLRSYFSKAKIRITASIEYINRHFS